MFLSRSSFRSRDRMGGVRETHRFMHAGKSSRAMGIGAASPPILQFYKGGLRLYQSVACSYAYAARRATDSSNGCATI